MPAAIGFEGRSIFIRCSAQQQVEFTAATVAEQPEERREGGARTRVRVAFPPIGADHVAVQLRWHLHSRRWRYRREGSGLDC